MCSHAEMQSANNSTEEKYSPNSGPKKTITVQTNNKNEAKTNNNTNNNKSSVSSPPQHTSSKLSSLFSRSSDIDSSHLFKGQLSNPQLSPKITELVQKSWQTLLDGDSDELKARKAADSNSSPVTAFYDVFYVYLFDKHPDTRIFFTKGGIKVRAVSLIKMISSGLHYMNLPPEKIKQGLVLVATSHGGAGIGPQHYSPVVEAMLFALEQLLGNKWTPDVKEAWIVLYSVICNVSLIFSRGQVFSQYCLLRFYLFNLNLLCVVCFTFD